MTGSFLFLSVSPPQSGFSILQGAAGSSFHFFPCSQNQSHHDPCNGRLEQGCTSSTEFQEFHELILSTVITYNYIYLFYCSVRVAATKYHRLGDLNRNMLSHSSKGQKSKINSSAGLVTPEAVRQNLFNDSPLASGCFLEIFGIP